MAAEIVEDNARKFTLDGLEAEFLDSQHAVSYLMTTDWLDTREATETKLAHKAFDNGELQLLLIHKVTGEDDSRTSEKEKLDDAAYAKLLGGSVLQIVKRRYEFEYTQGDMTFSLKYDEFADSVLRMLEVDGTARESFDPAAFVVALTEIKNDPRYTGYRVAEILELLKS